MAERFGVSSAALYLECLSSLRKPRKAATLARLALMRMSGPLTYSIVDSGYVVSEGIEDHTQHSPSLRERGHLLRLLTHGEVSLSTPM